MKKPIREMPRTKATEITYPNMDGLSPRSGLPRYANMEDGLGLLQKPQAQLEEIVRA